MTLNIGGVLTTNHGDNINPQNVERKTTVTTTMGTTITIGTTAETMVRDPTAATIATTRITPTIIRQMVTASLG